MEKQITTKEKGIPCEVYTRVCGFFRPVNQFNRGKLAEFKQRKYFKIPEMNNETIK